MNTVSLISTVRKVDMSHASRNGVSVCVATGKGTGGDTRISMESTPAAGDGKNTSAAISDNRDLDIPVPLSVDFLLPIHAGGKIDLLKDAMQEETSRATSPGRNMMNTSNAVNTKFLFTREIFMILLNPGTRTNI